MSGTVKVESIYARADALPYLHCSASVRSISFCKFLSRPATRLSVTRKSGDLAYSSIDGITGNGLRSTSINEANDDTSYACSGGPVPLLP